MAAKVEALHLVRLNGPNYRQWKMQITLALQASDLWDIVDGTKPCPAGGDPAWTKLDVQARAILASTLDDAQSNHVDNCTTAKDMYDRLKDIHCDTSLLNRQHT